MRTCASAWAVAIATWITYLKAANRTPNTIRIRRYYVERFAATCEVFPEQVKFRHLTSFLANEEWGGETRKSARSGLVSFFGWMVDDGQIEPQANPALKLPKVGVERGLPRPAPDSVLQQGLWFADDKQTLMLMLAGYAGLRREEIAKVHARDVDWIGRTLLIHGKGMKERRVPLHPDLARALRAEFDRRSRGNVGRGFRLYVDGIGPDSYLFPGKHGHVTADRVGKILIQLLAGPWTGHTLRHRFASKAYVPERDLRAVQELLGHSKPETTARYVETPPQAKQAAVLAVGLDAA